MIVTEPAIRLKILVRGAVQGVGFRPFVYRLATELGLRGWVSNTAGGVHIELEGSQDDLRQFLLRLEPEKPALAAIQSLESSYLDPIGFERFEIRASAGGKKTALVLPDVATCPACLAEMNDPNDRRYRYPFINCTHCGPRYTIVERLPYDRPNTTMRRFEMCDACRAEYEDPANRRFHAQPTACPICGPQLALWDRSGNVLATRDDALMACAAALRDGQIVAVKGLGGFHLMVLASDAAAVRRLRERKHREEKPFALLYPAITAVREDCEVSDVEERLLLSPEAPIVLLRKRTDKPAGISPAVAPGNPYLGVMLPYTPLHHLLLGELGVPVVATSGNLSDEPIAIDEYEALHRLGGIADLFLVHDRPIFRPVDDSVARVVMGRELILRRARGYAPLPVHPGRLPENGVAVLAVGAHLKNTIALNAANNIFVSQHVGDLETQEAYGAFERTIDALTGLYEHRPDVVAADLHPDYLSSQYAAARPEPVVTVQHHYAHVLACMAENEIEDPVLGVSWDGTGLGTDGTIWGGEFLRVTPTGFERFGCLRPFPLPGGDRATREPRRSALGVLFECYGESAFTMDGLAPLASFRPADLSVMRRMLLRGINCPRTSSAGRLFDAVASLLDLHQTCSFEGQAAAALEYRIADGSADAHYPFDLVDANTPSRWVVEWRSTIEAILDGLRQNVDPGLIARAFHNTLTEMIVAVAEKAGERRIVLSGGCFQNGYLLVRTVERLREAGFTPYWHQRVPPNDGGISLGQVVATLRNGDIPNHTGTMALHRSP